MKYNVCRYTEFLGLNNTKFSLYLNKEKNRKPQHSTLCSLSAMLSRVFIVFLIITTGNCLSYERLPPRPTKNKTADFRVSLRQILRLPEVNRSPYNLFKTREDFVKLAEQNVKNYKPYNYKLYRPYNPSKPVFVYDKDYVSKVLSSLGLLPQLQHIPLASKNTTNSALVTGAVNLNNKMTSSTELQQPVNYGFVTSESNGIETTTINYNNEDINTTTNSNAPQTIGAEYTTTQVGNCSTTISDGEEKSTEITTENVWSTIDTTVSDIFYNSSTESVTGTFVRIKMFTMDILKL